MFCLSKRTRKTCTKKSQRPSTSRFFPLAHWQEQPHPGHGRIDQRPIELLPANALSAYMRTAWPTIRSSARVTRNRPHVRAGKLNPRVIKSEVETTYLISSIAAPAPESLLKLTRNHWKIEIMHRDKDVTLGEDRYTHRSDHAPQTSSPSPVPH